MICYMDNPHGVAVFLGTLDVSPLYGSEVVFRVGDERIVAKVAKEPNRPKRLIFDNEEAFLRVKKHIAQ